MNQTRKHLTLIDNQEDQLKKGIGLFILIGLVQSASIICSIVLSLTWIYQLALVPYITYDSFNLALCFFLMVISVANFFRTKNILLLLMMPPTLLLIHFWRINLSNELFALILVINTLVLFMTSFFMNELEVVPPQEKFFANLLAQQKD